MNLENTKTEKCLMRALQGEAVAHLKYQFYKSMLNNFTTEYNDELDEIIHNEKEHGKIWFKQLNEGSIPSNMDNLLDAIESEKQEFTTMYPNFAEIAFEEGFDEIGKLFLLIGDVEGNHMEKFKTISEKIKSEDMFFKKEYKTDWKCNNCGFVIYSVNEAPVECPVCEHPRKYFEEYK